ncbi:hypothetical protein SAMN02745121_02481 [Nannocystis exedens]|uniref:Uncharacterized protein n=1 Tax=Nannocystis exedens TaxID=54 RepID=A0A1I1WS03_9BACT|nr:hypothetical protein [Nannocystis exedens]PCC71047.1 hypothetical protein NAEX_04117 [Nannocystis exedens]SFD97829.1 hypothetical protein SAMN02745121_02481 [Nannocystis exedens]
MDTLSTAPTSHGGLIFPLDMFRPTVLAAVIAELLLGKVRNILDATLEISRHPTSPLALARIRGSVVGDDPAEFWRTNPDIALAASQAVPRQCFVYYVRTGPNRREGFLVAQRGQALAADDSDRDATGQHWPVTRLVDQLRISVGDLANGFPGGPRIELSLMEPTGNDQNLLMTLVGQPPGGDAGEEDLDDMGEEPSPPPPPSRGGGLTQGFSAPPPSSAGAPGAASQPAKAPAKGPQISAAEDAKRRASERAAELQELQARSESAAKSLKYVEDERGLVVLVPVELSETSVLSNYMVPVVESSLPDGLPGSLLKTLTGRSIDFAVKVEFFSEVFVDAQPLNRPKFEERAREIDLGGTKVKALEVLAPRLGVGTLLRLGSTNVFVSRRPDAPLPAEQLLSLLKS